MILADVAGRRGRGIFANQIRRPSGGPGAARHGTIETLTPDFLRKKGDGARFLKVRWWRRKPMVFKTHNWKQWP